MSLALLLALTIFLHGCTMAPYVATPKSEYVPVPEEFIPEDKLSFDDHPEVREYSVPEPMKLAPLRRAQLRNVEGVVAVNFGIDKEGNPFNIHVLYVSSDQIMLSSFRKLISRLLAKQKFKPSTLNGKPIITHNITYYLKQCINVEGDRSVLSHRELACEGKAEYEDFMDSLETPEKGFTLN